MDDPTHDRPSDACADSALPNRAQQSRARHARSVSRPARALRTLAVFLVALAALFAAPPDASAQTPAVSSVALTSAPGSDNTYAIGDSVAATVTFDAAVDITGSPQLELDFDGTAKAATCATATNTTTMACSYTVLADDSAPDGVAIAANKLTGGTITATGSTTTTADLDHVAVAIDAGHKVDGIRPTLVTTGNDAPTTSTDGTKVILTFSENISSFDLTKIRLIMLSGFSWGPYAWRANGNKVEIDLETPVVSSSDNLDFMLDADAVEDGAGNGIHAVDWTPVINLCICTAPNIAPAFSSSTASRSVAENSASGTNVGAPVTATDADNDPLIYTLEGRDVASFDIVSTSGQIRTKSGVTYNQSTYAVIVKADDGNGGSDTIRVTITVTTGGGRTGSPLAVDDAAETPEDTPVTIAVLANDSDPDGDTLTVVEVSAPAHGTAVVADTGAVVYTPEPDYHGSDRFTYVVGDGSGLTAQAAVEVTVLPVSDPLQAVDDAAETPEDTPVTIAVLANDSNPDGDTLTVVEVSAPAHGTAVVADTGAVVYTPEPDYHGSDRFTYVVGDGSGLTAQAAVEVTVLPVNDPPQALGVIPDQTLEAGDGPASLDLSPFFEDRDGDELGYAAVASEPAVALSLAGATLTLTVARPGAAMVTVTAQDPRGLTATQAFMVTTTARQARGVVEDTLAALGRGHLASARATLGRRVETTGQEASRVTVAGLHVPLGTGAGGLAAAGQAVAEHWITGLAGGMPLQPGGWTGTGAGMAPGAFGAAGAFAAPALSGFSPLGGGGQTDFVLAFGSGQAGGGAAQGQRWTVWGQLDVQAFEGERSPAARYDGDLRTAYVGVDARLSDRWLAGVAVSRSRGDGDWTFGSSTGRLSTTLTSVQPYLRWSDGGTTIWATAGGGSGTTQNERLRYGLQEESDLGLRLGLVEVRRRLATVGGGVELQLRGDASWARLTTAAGDELIDALEVDVQQLRVGIDVSRPVRTAGGTLVEPFGEVHARHDGGSGQTGAGLEVAGGLRVARGVFRVEGMGRLLALHAAGGYREHGGAVTLSVGDGARQPGLTLSLSPRWGAPATASDALWQDHLFHQRAAGAPGEARDQRALDTRVDYGLQLPAGGLLTPFGIYGQSQYGRRLQVGLLLSRLGPLGLEVSGERSALLHPGRDEYRMSVLGRITFGGADNASASMYAVQ